MVIFQAKKEASLISNVYFFHMKRELNFEADLCAKKIVALTLGENF
jgi:hypothetical protein